jgi:hypothetical protein
MGVITDFFYLLFCWCFLPAAACLILPLAASCFFFCLLLLIIALCCFFSHHARLEVVFRSAHTSLQHAIRLQEVSGTPLLCLGPPCIFSHARCPIYMKGLLSLTHHYAGVL